MSQHHFAVSNQKLPGGKVAAKRRDKIAKEIDPTAGFIYYYDEARREYKSWGYCRSYGHPFDAATAKAIEQAWADAEKH